MSYPVLHIAIPALNELDTLPVVLDLIYSQKTVFDFKVYVCINQPESFRNNSKFEEICTNNDALISFLNNSNYKNLLVIDKSSIGLGWSEKQSGVGMARTVLYDEILQACSNNDIVISLDADTLFSNNYLQSIGMNFVEHSNCTTLSVPYYHPVSIDDLPENCKTLKNDIFITNNSENKKLLLRYEIFLRNWLINMLLIDNPYSFTALGSAIAVRVSALKKAGKIAPLQSGEDFYFLQKLCKMSPINLWNPEFVYPSGRESERVIFGTGPSIKKGMEFQKQKYPIYHFSLFENIKWTHNQLHHIYTTDINCDFINFLKEQFKDNDFLTPLRKNFKTIDRFTHAFYEKVDGLKLFQYIRNKNKELNITDEFSLSENIEYWKSLKLIDQNAVCNLSFEKSTTKELNDIRNLLQHIENQLRRKKG